jgi:hypothetical protein
VAPEGSVVAGLARGTAYKGAVLPRVSTFLLFVLDILSGNRRIELSSCSAPTDTKEVNQQLGLAALDLEPEA